MEDHQIELDQTLNDVILDADLDPQSVPQIRVELAEESNRHAIGFAGRTSEIINGPRIQTNVDPQGKTQRYFYSNT